MKKTHAHTPLVGLGLRRSLVDDLLVHRENVVDVLEVAPENWMSLGGWYAEALDELSRCYPMTAHGLSLSIGGYDPLDEDFIRGVRDFLERYGIDGYSDHLSYCNGEGHVYDLLPMPFNDEAVRHVAERVHRVQDILGRRIALENISYYATLDTAMSEDAFILAVLDAADCDLLLDVNNVYVNATNHGYDAERFIGSMPVDRVRGFHVAGHHREADLIVDTHGASVITDVWRLLDKAYDRFGVLPTILERDFDIPSLVDLAPELCAIRDAQRLYRLECVDA